MSDIHTPGPCIHIDCALLRFGARAQLVWRLDCVHISRTYALLRTQMWFGITSILLYTY